jgi:hypothetical protein
VEVAYRAATDYTRNELVDRGVLTLDLCHAHAAYLRHLFGAGRIVRTTRL